MSANTSPLRSGLICCASWCVALWLSINPSLSTADSELKFVETHNLRVLYYSPSEQFLVPPATQSLLSSLDKEYQLFGYVPSDKINVMLQDFSDMSQATTLVAPRNRIFMDVAPQSDPYEYTSAGDLFAWLSAHETASVALLDQASPDDERYRRWFHGKVSVHASYPESLFYYYLTTPRNSTPLWFPEGSAVFTETWMMGGLGRAQGGYDEMVFRAMVKEGAHFYDPLGLVSKGTEIDFETGADSYLYGTRFMNYLALTYDPAHLTDWWTRQAATYAYYATDFQRVFQRPLDDAWQDWIRWEQQFQRRNLEAVHQYPVTPFVDLTKGALGTVSRSFLSADGARLYAAVQDSGHISSLVEIRVHDGAVTRLHELMSPAGFKLTSLAYDPATETLFYTSNNANYRTLEAYDLGTHKARVLLKRARIGDIAFDSADRSLWGIRFNNGLAMLVKIPFPYNSWDTVHVFALGERPFDLDVSADGKLLSYSLARPGHSLSKPISEVRVVPVEALESGTPDQVFSLPGAVPERFVFSKDGHYLYGSSYYSGVSNIYRYDLKQQRMEAVTNTDVGFFNPLPVDDTRMIVQRFSSQGFVPTWVEIRPTTDIRAVSLLGDKVFEAHPELKSWLESPPSAVPLAGLNERSGAYHPLKEMTLESLIPVVQGYKQSVGGGFAAHFSDPMGFDSLALNASYSPDRALPAKERLHVTTDLKQGPWTLGAKWNGADFYDLFGPVRRSREGYSGYINYDRPLAFDPPSTMDFVVDLAYYGALDALPETQTVASPSQSLSTLAIGFRATDLRSSPGSVDYEAGHEWSVIAHAYGAAGEVTPSLQMEYHVGWPLALDHSSLWLRTAAVVAEGHVNSPLSNVYLGGFGNNYVDSRLYTGAQRYRGAMLSSMPGFEIGALNGRTLAKTMVEWCLPPIRFERVGSSGSYLKWARPEVFATVLETNIDNPMIRSSARNVGAQIDFRMITMNRFPMTLSIGVARGFGGEGAGKTEAMLSLLVL